jgi:hypothetical protein
LQNAKTTRSRIGWSRSSKVETPLLKSIHSHCTCGFSTP